MESPGHFPLLWCKSNEACRLWITWRAASPDQQRLRAGAAAIDDNAAFDVGHRDRGVGRIGRLWSWTCEAGHLSGGSAAAERRPALGEETRLDPRALPTEILRTDPRATTDPARACALVQILKMCPERHFIKRRQIKLVSGWIRAYIRRGTVVSWVSQPSSGFPQAGNNPISPIGFLTTVLLTRLSFGPRSLNPSLLRLSVSRDCRSVAWGGRPVNRTLRLIQHRILARTISLPAERMARRKLVARTMRRLIRTNPLAWSVRFWSVRYQTTHRPADYNSMRR